MQSVYVETFGDWRDISRRLIGHHINPMQVVWNSTNPQANFFPSLPLAEVKTGFTVSPAFISLAKTVSHHALPERWSLLYHALWRITHGEPHLLKLGSDALVRALQTMQLQVKRDAHKTKAFVRFRKVTDDDGCEHFIAWHVPDHDVLPIVAPFFQRRFSVMRWTILTPERSVHWDGELLHFGPGARAEDAVSEDALESLWLDYYRATFNPARIKIAMMKREMPVRHWPTLPETAMIPHMLEEAAERVKKMIAHQDGTVISAADFLPEIRDIRVMQEAAKSCRGCPLYKDATQVVFGEGPRDAKLMLVGEQPGDKEDLAGHPFVGPAGGVLDQAMQEAGVERKQLYLTNSVKHFKFSRSDGQRYHRTPTLRDITACKPWLEAEIEAVKPKIILCLGATAAHALIGTNFTLKAGRGHWLEFGDAQISATYHPSAVLRAPSESRKALYTALVQDLRQAELLAQAA